MGYKKILQIVKIVSKIFHVSWQKMTRFEKTVDIKNLVLKKKFPSQKSCEYENLGVRKDFPIGKNFIKSVVS